MNYLSGRDIEYIAEYQRRGKEIKDLKARIEELEKAQGEAVKICEKFAESERQKREEKSVAEDPIRDAMYAGGFFAARHCADMIRAVARAVSENK